ncbi:6-bladed beta-propeller [Parabacteroides provencensis]|uniref:6-bladed beta-propeller n=1 Tax=Parabacteroides provencensis TaxID=1944636 RepID=UPI0013047115|nr:6-bladed beta-propeller [Parabacteroides provencensis]
MSEIKMNMCKLLIVIGLVIVINSCQKDTDKKNMANIDNITISNNDPHICLDSIIKDISFIPLQTIDDNLIGFISNLVFAENRIIVGDNISSKGIYLFDCKGNFLNKVGNIGNGPGEYNNFTYITLTPDKKSIIVIDGNNGKALYYDLNGKYIKDRNLPFRSEIVEQFGGDKWIFTNTAGVYDGSKSLDNTLVITDSKGEILSSNFPSTYRKDFNLVTHPNHLMINNKVVYYNPNLSDTIYQLDKHIVPRYAISVKGTNRPSLEGNNAMRNYIDYIQNSKCFNGDFVELDKYIFIGLFPNGTYPSVYTKSMKNCYQINDEYDHTQYAFFKNYDILKSIDSKHLAIGTSSANYISLLEQIGVSSIDFPEINKEDNPIIIVYSFF